MAAPGGPAFYAYSANYLVDLKAGMVVVEKDGEIPVQSGEMDNPGRISRAGDPDVRCTLYTAANTMMIRSVKWSSLKMWGMQLAKTRGHRRAVVAVARKLAVILHLMWLDDALFRWGAEGSTS